MTAVTAGTRTPLVLVDTCVWVDHDRVGVPLLQDLLLKSRVVTSSDVVNELRVGCGSSALELSNRVSALPWIAAPDDRTLMDLIPMFGLRCCRIGVADARIVLAAHLADAKVLTFDRNLERVSERLGCRFAP